MRDDRERLLHILDATERIAKYVAAGRERFDRDELVQTWIIHHIQIIGEAAAKLSEDLRTRHPETPWSEIIAMRNIVVHEYFEVDPDEIWVTATRDVPELKLSIVNILKTCNPTD